MQHASPTSSAARKTDNQRVDIVALLVIVAVLAAVVALVSAPLRGDRVQREHAESEDAVEELEARKEAKYREIRDAEMDLRTGKLSDEDHRVLDRELRAEAVAILKALDDARR
jgi:gas vesicle protein